MNVLAPSNAIAVSYILYSGWCQAPIANNSVIAATRSLRYEKAASMWENHIQALAFLPASDTIEPAKGLPEQLSAKYRDKLQGGKQQQLMLTK